ncbi:MAG TPA: hypothetical protein VIK74_07845 [Parasegetibacter sp.]
MQKLLLSLLFLSLCTFGTAQIYEGTVDFDKKKQPAVLVDLPFPPQVAQDGIKKEMEKRGYSGKSTKGYILFKDVKLDELGGEPVDVYIKAEKKARNKDACTVYMLLSKGYDNFVTRDINESLFSGGKDFAKEFEGWTAAHSLELDVASQEARVTKEEKKYQKLIDEGNDMEKKLKKLQKEIEENKEAQIKQQQEIEVQKKVLETLKEKRKS